MPVRLFIYIICAILVAGLFLFEPSMNWGGQAGVSMFKQYMNQGQILEMLSRALLPAIVVFVGLIAYFGLSPKSKKEEDERK